MEQPSFQLPKDTRSESSAEHVKAENIEQEFNDLDTERVFDIVERLIKPHAAEYTDEAIDVRVKQLSVICSELAHAADAFKNSPDSQSLSSLKQSVIKLQELATENEKRNEVVRDRLKITSDELKGYNGKNIYAVGFHDRLSNEIAGVSWALHRIQESFGDCIYWLGLLEKNPNDAVWVEDISRESMQCGKSIAKAEYLFSHFFRTTKDTVDHGAEMANSDTNVAYGTKSRRKTPAYLLTKAAHDDWFEMAARNFLKDGNEEEFTRKTGIVSPASLRDRFIEAGSENLSSEDVRSAVAEEAISVQQPWERSFGILEEAGIFKMSDIF